MVSPLARRVAANLGHLCLLVCLSAAGRAAVDYSTPYSFTTLAGLSSIGSDDGPAAVARFYGPSGVAVDRAGNIYVADQKNNTIRKITPAGVTSTIAGTPGVRGSTDGPGSIALFGNPQAVAVDDAGNLYVTDKLNLTVRKITPGVVVTTLAGTACVGGSADGTGADARFSILGGVAVDPAGNVYVAEWDNQTIRKITPAGVVTTLAGTAGTYGSTDGVGANASFMFPFGIAVDAAGTVYVSELNSTIRKITPDGRVTTLAGRSGANGSADGVGSDARFKSPTGIAVDRAGIVYVGDSVNETIRRITPEGVVTTLAGVPGIAGSADGASASARFRHPGGLAIDVSGAIYAADENNNTIRRISPTGQVTTVAGLGLDNSIGSADGAIVQARFDSLASVAVGPAGVLYIADTVNSTIRKITPDGIVTTLAGTAGTPGSEDGVGSAARFASPYGIAVDAAGTLYVSDPGNDNIRKITSTGVVTTLAGYALMPANLVDGTGLDARFNFPSGLAADEAGNVYVADRNNRAIRKITPAGVVTTIAGGAGDWVFEAPQGIAVDTSGNVYVADAAEHGMIKKIDPLGHLTTLAGGAGGEEDLMDGVGANARFRFPAGVTVDRAGIVYVSDSANHTIRRITPGGVVSTVAGLAEAAGSADGLGRQSRFLSPPAVTVDPQGNLYVTSGTTIRKGQLATTPIITAQPSSLAVAAGTTATLAVTAAAVPEPTYQWQHNGAAINGATSRSLTIAGAQAADAGSYTVIVTNPLGSATSTAATLTVTAAAPPPPASPATGGGGSITAWFVVALLALGGARLAVRHA